MRCVTAWTWVTFLFFWTCTCSRWVFFAKCDAACLTELRAQAPELKLHFVGKRGTQLLHSHCLACTAKGNDLSKRYKRIELQRPFRTNSLSMGEHVWVESSESSGLDADFHDSCDQMRTCSSICRYLKHTGD